MYLKFDWIIIWLNMLIFEYLDKLKMEALGKGNKGTVDLPYDVQYIVHISARSSFAPPQNFGTRKSNAGIKGIRMNGNASRPIAP
jgi:hypothetical protein